MPPNFFYKQVPGASGTIGIVVNILTSCAGDLGSIPLSSTHAVSLRVAQDAGFMHFLVVFSLYLPKT